ncbi:MAG: tryptophan synthase subunit alpha [Actinobacteria bacterium]|nr:tryptophan synthase subunit alpha [Actinomycetota bacterium]
MKSLAEVFADAGRPLLMPYAVGGYPDMESCARILRTYREAGADLIEIGIPFSDPLADGPVIQAASTVALARGVRPGDVLELAARAASEGARIVLLSYLNTILAFGPERFFAKCGQSGVLGVVVPDLPVEEAAELQAQAKEWSVDMILLVAPTSTDARLRRITAAASGFIYCVSTTGVTGARATLRSDLPSFLERVRQYTKLPLAVGFGVSTVEQVAAVAAYADGVIIGSALVDMVAKNSDFASSLTAIREYLGNARATLVAGSPH